jgi:hypothetical protein
LHEAGIPEFPPNDSAAVQFSVYLHGIELRVFRLNDVPLPVNAFVVQISSQAKLFRNRHRRCTTQFCLIKTGLQFPKRRINLMLSHICGSH